MKYLQSECKWSVKGAVAEITVAKTSGLHEEWRGIFRLSTTTAAIIGTRMHRSLFDR